MRGTFERLRCRQATLALAALFFAAGHAAAAVRSGSGPAPAFLELGQEPGQPATGGFQEHLLAVDLNGQKVSDGTVVLRRTDGTLYVPADAAAAWRLSIPGAEFFQRDGTRFVALPSGKRLQTQVDTARQILILKVDPAFLQKTVVEGRQMPQPVAARADFAGFLNYNFNIEHSALGSTQVGAFEFGISSRYGLGTGTMLVQHLNRTVDVIRLDTAWIMDRPEDMTSLRFGDTITRPWQRGFALRFAGVQYATDFGTQPRFVFLPLQSVSGEVAQPSMLDIFVNGNLVQRRDVAAGPFSVRDLPVVTGTGEVSVVARDVLGREQVITQQPFYTSRTMLREGLAAFSYEAGFLRRSYGTQSNQYGPAFASATYRYGLTNWMTGEIHGQALTDQVALGTGGSVLVDDFGVVDLALAASEGRAGLGGLAGLGFFRQGRNLSLGASAAVASRDFRQLGIQPGDFAATQAADGFVGWSFGNGASVNVRASTITYPNRPHVNIYAATYTQNLWSNLTLNVSAMHVDSAQDDTLFALILTVPLAENTYATATARSALAQGQPAQTEGVFQVARNLGWGPGWGYRLDATTTNIQRGLLNVQTDYGLYGVEAANFQGSVAARAFGSGGIGLIEGHPFLSRRIEDSFAIAKVGDYANVAVYADNQYIGRTNEQGYVLLPRLRAYDVNLISIDQADLPLDAQIDSLRVPVSPYFRSGVVVDFPVRRARGALVKVLLSDGKPLPSGASVQIEGVAQEFPVGLDGDVYLTGLSEKNRLSATWGNQRCVFDVPYPETQDPLPHLGAFVCKGVKR